MSEIEVVVFHDGGLVIERPTLDGEIYHKAIQPDCVDAIVDTLALRSDSPVRVRITSRERPPLVIEDEPASTGGERDEPEDFETHCKECGEELDDEWRCPNCYTGPKMNTRPLIPEGAVPVEVVEIDDSTDHHLRVVLAVAHEHAEAIELDSYLLPRNRDGGDDG